MGLRQPGTRRSARASTAAPVDWWDGRLPNSHRTLNPGGERARTALRPSSSPEPRTESVMTRSRRFRLPLGATLSLVLAAAACAPAASVQTAPSPASAESLFPATEDLQVMLDYLVEDGETPGIILGIVEPDGSTRILQAGTAGEDARPLSPRTVFEIGSINKTFTGALLADMAAKGEVALDDPVQRYLPDSVRVPTRNGRQITLLDLATHRSALPRLPTNHLPADPGNPYADYTVPKLYAFLDGHELRRDIGAEFEYSNLAMGLLGHALSRAAGTPLDQLIRERITDPLGMEMTSYDRTGAVQPWLARGHNAQGRPVPYWDLPPAMAGAGGLRSNMEDMLTYLRAQLGPADDPLERAMRASHTVHHRFPRFGMGLGWRVREENGRTIVVHTGGTGGFNTLIAFDPERRTGAVMLTNTNGFDDDFALDFLLRGAPLDRPAVDVPGDVLASYVGEYRVSDERNAVVRREEDGTMTFRMPPNVRFRMYADSDTSFHLKRTPWRISFARDASGRVTGMALDMNDTVRTLPKVSDQAPRPGDVADLPLTPSEREAYVGTYLLRLGERTMEIRVFVQDGRLMSQAQGQESFALRSQGGHVFIPTFDEDVRLVFTMMDGRANGVTLHQDGREIPGERIR